MQWRSREGEMTLIVNTVNVPQWLTFVRVNCKLKQSHEAMCSSNVKLPNRNFYKRNHSVVKSLKKQIFSVPFFK